MEERCLIALQILLGAEAWTVECIGGWQQLQYCPSRYRASHIGAGGASPTHHIQLQNSVQLLKVQRVHGAWCLHLKPSLIGGIYLRR